MPVGTCRGQALAACTRKHLQYNPACSEGAIRVHGGGGGPRGELEEGRGRDAGGTRSSGDLPPGTTGPAVARQGYSRRTPENSTTSRSRCAVGSP
jgi:hypothetical protein